MKKIAKEPRRGQENLLNTPTRTSPANLRRSIDLCRRTFLSPLSGLAAVCSDDPRLAPWVAFFRRFAADAQRLRPILVILRGTTEEVTEKRAHPRTRDQGLKPPLIQHALRGAEAAPLFHRSNQRFRRCQASLYLSYLAFLLWGVRRMSGWWFVALMGRMYQVSVGITYAAKKSIWSGR